MYQLLSGCFFTQGFITCCAGVHGGDVAPVIIILDDENNLTLAFVYVSADLFVGLEASAGRANASEATHCVTALAACTVLQKIILITLH